MSLPVHVNSGSALAMSAQPGGAYILQLALHALNLDDAVNVQVKGGQQHLHCSQSRRQPVVKDAVPGWCKGCGMCTTT